MDLWLERSADRQDITQSLQTLLRSGRLNEGEPALMVHDLAKMRSRFRRLQQSFPSTTLHTLAVKANPLLSVLREAVEQGLGLEAASLGELELALAAGCSRERLVFDSPAKSRQDMERAKELDVVLNANSVSEVQRLVRYGVPSRFGLRCNPLVGREATTMVATEKSKFGVPIVQAREVLRTNELINGLHIHVGSQLTSLEDLTLAASRLVELAQEFGQIEWLDIGGGLPTRYRSQDPGLTPEDYWQALSQAAPELQNYKLITEIGRALQANCGWAVSRVEYAQDGRCILHFGADLFLRECYQAQTWFHEIQVFDSSGQPKEGDLEEIDIFGPLCFSGDQIAKDRLLPRVEEGDLVVVHDCGAYTLGMWSRYCSRRAPAVVSCEGQNVEVLKERETLEDVVRFWS